ncbi:phosphopantetheine-binding protein, partial [Streptosporangium sp. NPDC006013]|uniref:phosphopantetheine-binding protein n=1 Tax=Streptosporangium sp. NPDC006013 TaxID=3155596 RepID=UPI0033B2C497
RLIVRIDRTELSKNIVRGLVAYPRAYVVDAAFNPVPVGVVGELCLGGPRVSRGYLRQPGLTADRFVPDPFGEEPGERLYRTGDQVRYRPDGVIEFIGRIDAQVKLRGFRIELGEIETALAAHPGVQAAAAAVQELAPGDRRLVGYVVPASRSGAGSGVAPSSPELRAHLRDRVPEYMVPALFVTLDGLPATAGQKVDRRALPVPDPGTALAPEEAVPPGTEVEEAIAAAWADVLGLPAVGVAHDFFELGGHSLLATRLMALLQDLFGLEIPLRVLFEATTVRAQATALERLAEAAAPTSYEGRDDEH